MTDAELERLLSALLNEGRESEIVEFKEAKNGYDFNKLGKYFSALSNEARLLNKASAWLVFGIEDKKLEVVGSNFRQDPKTLDNLKIEISNKTTNNLSFVDIHIIRYRGKRIIMFQIPAAPRGIPIAFEGHYYGRNGSSLTALNIEEMERIRRPVLIEDWSASVLPEATLDDLDKNAVLIALQNYKIKYPHYSTFVDNWDDITFLNKAKLTIKGQITRTAILLLGKEESEYFLSPAEAKIRWVLKDSKNNEKDYEIFICPLLLSVNKVFSKIRNIKYRYIKDESLFPDEVDQYDPFTIREAINNCIAHQDYNKSGRINVIEEEDKLVFSNLGSFIPGSVEKVVYEDAPEEHYRNPFLVNAMFNLNMVDTAGGGIKKMFNIQKRRFFPMPDYDLSNNKVKVTITGKVVDLQYAKLLVQNDDLTLFDIIILDKVQKKKSLNDSEIKYLKSKNFIEGRKPNFYLSIGIAQKINQKTVYTKMKAFDKSYYQDLILNAIKQHNSLNRKDIDDLLWDKLPDWMGKSQKKNKVTNLVAELRQKGKIINAGSDYKPQWTIFTK